MSTSRTPRAPLQSYSFEAACGSSDDTKEEEMSISVKNLHQLQDDEMESLLDEIECGYDENTQDIDDEQSTHTQHDNLIGFGINDEAIEKQESIIEDILDEIEEQEAKTTPHKDDKLWQYSRLIKDVIHGNNNNNAFKLRLHKQKTFANFLKMEKIVAKYSTHKTQTNTNDKDIFINDTELFYCPFKMDYLLHGFIRNIIRETCNIYTDNNYILSRMVPQVVIQLIHSYYLSPNNRYHVEMGELGINWNEHRVIVQHQNCNLWRWESIQKRWKQCNGLKEMGQTTLLYDCVKGFTRFVHFDCARNMIGGLQIIEGNEKIKKENILHYDNREETVFEFGGFDFMYLLNSDSNNNEDNIKYGQVSRFKMEIMGANHRYYATQFVKCYNNIIDLEINNEIKMLKKMPSSNCVEEEVVDLSHLNEYVLGLQSRDDIAKHILYSRLIRKLLSAECRPPIQEIVDCGIIQRLIYLMQYSLCLSVKFECSWCLTNIASGNGDHTLTLIRFNAINALLNVFKNGESIVEIKEQCLWALGNIAGDSVLCRNAVLNADILSYVLPLIRPYRMLMFNNKCDRQRTFMRNLVWTLSNLNRNKPLPSFNHIILSLHAINIILKDEELIEDKEVITDCCWTLSYLSDYDNNNLDSILLDSGIIDILIGLLSHPVDAIKHPSLRTIGNIATGNDYLTSKLLAKPGILNGCATLLLNKESSIKRETLWLISNITAGDTNQIQLILDHNELLSRIINILNDETEENCVKREAVWAISNATSGGTHQQIRYICDNNGIYVLSRYLMKCINDRYFGKVLNVCCEGVENMLNVGAHDAITHNNAILGQNTQNIYAVFVEHSGALHSFEQVLLDDECPDDTKERIVSILDSYFPFR